MSKPILRYVELRGSGCGLTTDTPRDVLRVHGTANVKTIRNATAADLEWVRSMGGHVPEPHRIANPSTSQEVSP